MTFRQDYDFPRRVTPVADTLRTVSEDTMNSFDGQIHYKMDRIARYSVSFTPHQQPSNPENKFS